MILSLPPVPPATPTHSPVSLCVQCVQPVPVFHPQFVLLKHQEPFLTRFADPADMHVDPGPVLYKDQPFEFKPEN